MTSSTDTNTTSGARQTVLWILGILLVIIIANACQSTGTSNSTTSSDSSLSDTVSQTYYYCWNSGNPRPHHLGFHVFGDHLCTDGELGR